MKSVLVVAGLLCWLVQYVSAFQGARSAKFSVSSFPLEGKKKGGKPKGAKGPPTGRKKQTTQESAKVREQRFDAATRQFMFTLTGLSKTTDSGKQIMKNINLSFYPGAKIGVVGLNGAGKSSLLRIMAGDDKEYEGTARPLPGASIGYLQQEPELEGETVEDAIQPAIAKAQAVLDRYNDAAAQLSEPLSDEEMTQVLADIEEIQTEIDAGDLWELDRRVERAMESLRCPPKDAKTDVLSGGERRRVALCRLLLENHDLLLLDEPTNHLDSESVAWLEVFLAQFTGTVVAVTHDRYFLNNVAKWILELDRGSGIPHEGNYESWLEAKAKRLEGEKKSQAGILRTINTELEWVRSSPKAKQSKSKARLKAYDDLMNARPDQDEVAQSATIYIPPGPRLGEVVIDAKGLRKQFGDRLLFDGVDFTLPRNGIVGVIGPNGAGKSTMMKMFAGMVEADGGDLRVGETVKMVTVDQMRGELESDRSVFDEITGGQDFLSLGSTEVNSRAYVSWFGFKSSDQQKKVGVLSGGERNRVQLAKLLRAGGNVMILDEPTNDLDVDTLRALEDAILNFAGCAVCVSHDRYFLDRVATHILAFEGDSKVVFFEGNYQEYAANRQQRLGLSSSEPKPLKFAPLVGV